MINNLLLVCLSFQSAVYWSYMSRVRRDLAVCRSTLTMVILAAPLPITIGYTVAMLTFRRIYIKSIPE